MPCNCEHMEPTYSEIVSKEACELICYLFPKINKKVPQWAKEGAKAFYGAPARRNEAEDLLLNTVMRLGKLQTDKYVYDGRNPKARKLADWIATRGKRIKSERRKERKKIADKKRAEKILSRLRAEEVKILENYYKGER